MSILRNYTRVSIFLPLTEESLPKIYQIIVELCDKFKGVTHSRPTYPAEFVGWYIEERDGEKIIYKENIVWIIVDVDTSAIPDIEKYFLEFKSIKEAEFKESEIWITCYSITRFTSGATKGVSSE